MDATFTASAAARPRDSGKFHDPLRTASGEACARVAAKSLDTLWFNTGTLCNLTCFHCYIESSPRNDRLVYLTAADVAPYLDEIAALRLGTGLIGLTGGEPFMNPHLAEILELTLKSGFRVLVLTNAMKPMHKAKPMLLRLRQDFGGQLQLRVSLDHYGPAVHEAERGPGSWLPTIDGLLWLGRKGLPVAVGAPRP